MIRKMIQENENREQNGVGFLPNEQIKSPKRITNNLRGEAPKDC